MTVLDLTPFGFTPTESKVYGVLLADGPGTGYAVARASGLARANAYSALEGLVAKGAARSDGQPRQYRPEPPATLLARVAASQGEALEGLTRALENFGPAASPAVIEIQTPKGALHLLNHQVARATRSVLMIAPAEAYPLLGPSLRRVIADQLDARLYAQVPVSLPFTRVEAIPSGFVWPGLPLVSIIDDRSAIIASRQGTDVTGHWSTAASFVAAARHTFDRLRGGESR